MISTVTVPDMQKLEDKSAEELKNLAITQVLWNGVSTLSFTLSDGQKCSVGKRGITNSYTFNPNLKITRVEVIIDQYEE